MEMLATHLIEKGLLTSGEYEELNSRSTNWKQNKYFVLDVLPKKGKEGFKRFLECLKDEKEHLGHQDLFHLLNKSG